MQVKWAIEPVVRENTFATNPDDFAVQLVTKLNDFWKAGKYPGDLTLQGIETWPDGTRIIDATGPGHREYKGAMKFRVLPINDTHITVKAECRKLPGLPEFFLELWAALEKVYDNLITIKVISKPPIDAPIEQFFDYYHACKVAGRRYTLKDVATDKGYKPEYVRRLHAQYVRKNED